MQHIAVVGAGISGLACARHLHAKGLAVTVFERNIGVGGRIVTHETEVGGFDYGAQFFTAISDGFKREVAAWRAAGMAAPWHGRLVRLDAGSIKPASPSSQRFVAIPGMGALTRYLAQGLDVRLGHTIKRIDPERGQTIRPQWWLTVAAGDPAVKSRVGPYDAVVVATPADKAAALLKSVPTLAARAEKAGHVPCWALMLAFQDSLDLPYDGAWPAHPDLAWVARDASKPDRPEGERWIVLARVDWSASHLKETAARARDTLLKAFRETTGVTARPVHSVARLWHYAQSVNPIAKSCLWDEKARIGACGDWFTTGLEGSGQIEHAFMSGQMLAARVLGA